jgi:Mg-chelatase subunit ChlD
MKTALAFLAEHWLAFAFIGTGLVALVVALLLRGRLGRGFTATALVCAGVVLAGVGGLSLPSLQAAYPVYLSWGFWLFAAAAVVLFGMVLVLVLTGVWSKWAVAAVSAVALLGFGGWALDATGQTLHDWFWTLATVEFLHPWWLLLLLLAPVSIAIAWRALFRFESVRPWIAAVLRTAGIILLALALAEPKVRQPGEHVTVLFVVDRSLSIPTQYVEAGGAKEGDDKAPLVDLRKKRILRFLNDAVQQRNELRHSRDRAGLIVFGKQPRLELPPSDAPRFNLTELPAARDGNYTDIGAAIKMALASFPEDAAKRIVLLSDGNENLGSAEEQARLARSMGVQIDVVPLAAGQRNEEEVLVERVQAPSLIEQGSKVPIRVLVRSYNPHHVGGVLTLKQITEGPPRPVGQPLEVVLQYGLNSYSFDPPLTNEQRSYTYEAEFQPKWYEDSDAIRHEGKPPGDRTENNKASAHVVARGQKRILILEGKEGEQRALEDALLAAGNSKFKVARQPVSVLQNYPDNDKLAVFLSNFDCLILANVPEDVVTDDQQKMIRSNTEDQGCGLIMIGGPDSFGAGGWQDTPVEKALPVDSEIKSLKVQGKGGLVLIMHGCEMMDGNVWEKKIAKLAIQRLGPADEIGVIDGMEQWHIPLQEIGDADNKNKLLGQLDKLQPGDMPTFDNALGMARTALNKDDNDPMKKLATKHVILISDGDPQCVDYAKYVAKNANDPPALLPAMKKEGITVTTVGVATHGAPEDQKMSAIAKMTGGNTYKVTNPANLPAIYVKESRLVSQSFIERKKFGPVVEFRSGPTQGLPDPVQDLTGYVRTTPKPSALVEIPIRTPKWADQEFPLLAYWHYGLGKSVAFTSDAGRPENWSKLWTEGGIYNKFWEQVVDWSLRPTESSRMQMVTEYRDGKIHITVDARTEQGDPDTKLTLRGGITTPNPDAGDDRAQKRELRFVQTNSGRYEATIAAEESGSYFVTAQAVHQVKIVNKDGKEETVEEGVDSVRSGVTLPYSPEFAEEETNAPLLEKLREITGGRSYADDDDALAKAAAQGDLFRPANPVNPSKQPVWQWMLVVAAVLLFLDVAVRRVSVDVEKVREFTWRSWARLRGIALPPEQPEVLERLQNRKAAVGAALDRTRATRRFEATGDYGPAPAGAHEAAAPPAPSTRPAARPDSPSPEGPEPTPGDAIEALRRAKRRARGEDKDKPK